MCGQQCCFHTLPQRLIQERLCLTPLLVGHKHWQRMQVSQSPCMRWASFKQAAITCSDSVLREAEGAAVRWPGPG